MIRADLGAPPAAPPPPVVGIAALALHALPDVCARCCAALRRRDRGALCPTGRGHFDLAAGGWWAARRAGCVYAVVLLLRGEEDVRVLALGRLHDGAPGLPADAAHGGTPAERPWVELLEARGEDGAVVELTPEEQVRAREALEEEL